MTADVGPLRRAFYVLRVRSECRKTGRGRGWKMPCIIYIYAILYYIFRCVYILGVLASASRICEDPRAIIYKIS